MTRSLWPALALGGVFLGVLDAAACSSPHATSTATSASSSASSSGAGTGTGGAGTGGQSGTGGDAGAPACKTRGEQLGLNQYLSGDPTVAGMTLDGIASFGVTWARLYWAWPYSQSSSSSPGNYTPVKQIADAAHARGLKLLVVATGAPGWANGGGGDNAPPDDAHIPDFGAFTAGVAQADVDAVEVWNEPNNAGFWTGTLDPARMARMQIAAYQAIKALRPEVPVITGGLTQVAYQPQDYFEAMLAVASFAHSFDGVGLHPYMQPGDPLDATLEPPNIMMVQTPAIHQMLVAAGVGDRPFWYTEIGTPTGGPGSVTEAQQATYYTHYFQGFDMLRAQGIPFGINLVYEMQDWSKPDPSSEEPYFGLLHADGSDKPSAAVVRSYAKASCNDAGSP